jgi:hypothetical protein
MQHDTPDILFSLLKMTFNLRVLINQEFNCIDKIKKTLFFVRNFETINIVKRCPALKQ